MSKSTKYQFPKQMGKHERSITSPSSKDVHKGIQMKYAKEYLMTNFSIILFADECQTLFSGSNGLSKDWVTAGRNCLYRFVISTKVVWYFGMWLYMVKRWESVKMWVKTYIDFWKHMRSHGSRSGAKMSIETCINFWMYTSSIKNCSRIKEFFKNQNAFRKIVFMHGNALLHSAKKVNRNLNKINFKENSESFSLAESNLPTKTTFGMLFLMLYSTFHMKTSIGIHFTLMLNLNNSVKFIKLMPHCKNDI